MILLWWTHGWKRKEITPSDLYRTFGSKVITPELRLISGLRYESFSTGIYKGGYPGLVLHFVSSEENDLYHCIFNVQLHRRRNSRFGAAGSKLPGKQFRVRRRHEFYKFWLRSGLKLPPRLGSFHDYMGKLNSRTYSAEKHPERLGRLVATSLSPIPSAGSSALEARAEIVASKLHTNPAQGPDYFRALPPYKQWEQTQRRRGIAKDWSTCGGGREEKLVSKDETSGSEAHQTIPPTSQQTITSSTTFGGTKIDPRSQSVEDWLADYDS